ncbi:hypothetical protein ABBQ38_013148 [Trebouxia sp. C0009 RCD-2024]
MKANMAAALSELRNMQQLQDVLEQAQVSRQGAAESSERYKNFSQVTEVEETELVDAAYYSTLCSTCRVVTASVETVVGDMKQKHDKAQRQVQDANAGIAQAEADLVLVRQVQYEKMERIKKLCKSIQGIASRFNLVDELTVALSGLVVQAKQLKSVNARDTADKDIMRLQCFINQLSTEGAYSARSQAQKDDLDKPRQSMLDAVPAEDSPLQLLVSDNQVSRLVKLLANKGRRKQEIVAATGCSLSVPATEDWDEDNGVTITFANGDVRKAQQLVMDFLAFT